MSKDKIIRIVLTGLVLLLGGYYIQKSSSSLSKNPSTAEGIFVDSAKADVPTDPPVGK